MNTMRPPWMRPPVQPQPEEEQPKQPKQRAENKPSQYGRTVSDIDVKLAERMRKIRKDRNETMQDVSASLGITYQQVQKYEKAGNRISASMLYRLAKHYGMPVAYFFEGIEEEDDEQGQAD